MSSVVEELTAETFPASVSDGTTLVDFWAQWCGPCRMQTPILESVAQKVTDGTKIAQVDVDAHPTVAEQFNVQSVPTLVLLKNGQEVHRFVGVRSEAELLSAIERIQ